MPKELSEVLAVLPKLSQSDLKTARSAIDLLLKPQAPVRGGGPLYDEICRAASHPLPFSKFSASNEWLQAQTVVTEFVNSTFPKLRKPTHLAILRMLVEGASGELRDIGIPVTHKTLMQRLGQAPAVFDRMFPDYRKSGLAGVIVKRIEGRSTCKDIDSGS